MVELKVYQAGIRTPLECLIDLTLDVSASPISHCHFNLLKQELAFVEDPDYLKRIIAKLNPSLFLLTFYPGRFTYKISKRAFHIERLNWLHQLAWLQMQHAHKLRVESLKIKLSIFDNHEAQAERGHCHRQNFA